MLEGKKWLTPLFFVIAIGYVNIGVFPFAPMESDGNHIANGVHQMLLQAPSKNPFSYRYEAQSGTYWLIYGLSKISSLQPLDAFCLLSALSALVFLLGASLSLARLTGEDFALVGLMLLAFQEVWTNAFYANSNILAGAFLFSGFLVAIDRKTIRALILAGVLLGLSVWMRFDAVLMFAVLPLLIGGKSWREIGLKTFLIASLAAVIVLIALRLSNVSLSEILLSSQRHFQLRAAPPLAWAFPG